MIFVIGRNILLSFLALVFLPLVVMAFFSGTIINQEIEKYATANLKTSLKAIELIYNNSAIDLEKSVIDKTANIKSPVRRYSNNLNIDNSIDILVTVNSSEIKKYVGIRRVLRGGLKKTITCTELIPESFINEYGTQLKHKLLTKGSDNKEILASLAQISVTPVKKNQEVLVGVKFVKINSKIWKEISQIVKGRVLFIQKNYVVSEIVDDKANENNLVGSKISSSIYNQINNFAIFTSSINLSSKNYISVINPLSDFDNLPVGAIFLAVSQNDFDAFKKQNATLIVLTIFSVGIITSSAAYIISQKVITSLDQIAAVASAVRNGDLSKRVGLETQDKMGHLGENMNKMIDALHDRETKIKEYQREIQEQNENLKAIFNSLADGIIIISNDYNIIKVNPPVCRWLGLEEEKIIGKKLYELIRCKCTQSCIDEASNLSGCPIITQNERLSPTEAKIANFATKAEKTLGLTSSPISGIEGEPTFVIVLRDITEFKAISNMREDFMATLTHDLRVPILAESNTIKFFLKGVFGPYTEKQMEALENMLESNSDLLGLVNSLLDTYKYESGRSELFKEPVHIKKLVQDLIAELTPLAKRADQNLNNVISKELPIIDIDRNEIKRVIRNLINNAITYSPKAGTITIDAEVDEDNIIIKVIDNGKGIPEAELEQVFDRFFSKAKKFRKIGTGLGLYLSKQIIEKHNGKIWAESIVGKGSTFYISLPLQET